MWWWEGEAEPGEILAVCGAPEGYGPDLESLWQVQQNSWVPSASLRAQTGSETTDLALWWAGVWVEMCVFSLPSPTAPELLTRALVLTVRPAWGSVPGRSACSAQCFHGYAANLPNFGAANACLGGLAGAAGTQMSVVQMCSSEGPKSPGVWVMAR